MSDEDPMWSIATRSRKPQSTAEQELEISMGQASVDIVFAAQIDSTNGEVFQHLIAVPNDFQAETVEVTMGDESVSATTQHDGSGVLTVFLGRGIKGQHQLKLVGRQRPTDGQTPQDGPRQVVLPDISLQQVSVLHHFVRLYRRPDTLVTIVSEGAPSAWRPSDWGRFRAGFGRLIAVFDKGEGMTSQFDSVTLQLTPNHPEVNARLVTTLRRVNDDWEAIADFTAQLASKSQGVADMFRFEIPPEWEEPLVFEPSVPHEILSIPGQGRQLIVRPYQPVADRFAIRIRGRLSLEPNERGRTPNIVPLDAAHSERYFVLPTQLDQQRIDWETSGLRPVRLRDAIPTGPVDSDAYVAYLIWAKPRAVIADVQRIAGERQISLADVHVAYDQHDRCYGLVTFQIEPAGAEICTLELPPELELVAATIEGSPATLVPLADRRWHVRLVSQQLPQQLAVLFQGGCRPAEQKGVESLIVPWIAGFDIVRTLWTIRGPSVARLQGKAAEQPPISQVQQESIRLRNTASLIESAVDSVLDSPAGEVRAWYQPWIVRVACSEARIERFRWAARPNESTVGSAAMRAIGDQQQSIAQRLNTNLTLTDVRQETAHFSQPADLWEFGRHPGTVTSRFSFFGARPELTVAFEPSLKTAWWPTLLASLVLGLAGCGLGILSRRGWLASWFRQWPHFVGVLLGVVWWLFASPSWLGWVIVAVGLFAAFRLPIPTHRVKRPIPDLSIDAAESANSNS
jgi:hypothetical protein